jgi:glycosyltransferase involved in cell wall biosynthesis
VRGCERDNRQVSIRRIQPHDNLDADRGEVIVCIVVAAGDHGFDATLSSVLAHTSDDVLVLICGGPGADLPSSLRDLDTGVHRVWYLACEQSGSFATVRNACLATAPADVVVLKPGCRVGAEWLERIREAANVDARVATAVALSDDGRPSSAYEFDAAAAAVRSGSLRLRPRLRTASGPCVYVRRSALELLGDVDCLPSPDSGDEFSRQCLERGLCHVLADDVLVLYQGRSAFAVPRETDSTKPLARSLGAARRALEGLSVLIDARSLIGPTSGTNIHVLELIAAVTRTQRARVTAIVPNDISPDASAVLQKLPAALVTVGPGGGLRPAVRADVVHRPFQISTPADLTFLAQVADRLVITHQDLISYHNPGYFRSPSAWEGYRDLTRRALSVADRVVFLSEHVREDAFADDLVEPHRADVVRIGVDHHLTRAGAEDPQPPRGAARIPRDVEVMLCLGTDFRHKNRVFALRLLDELQRRHGWPGWLVMAGPGVAFGSSIPEEEHFLSRQPSVADVLVRLDALRDDEKAWLLRRADLVLYPSVQEGFGLVPFEAADHGVPCLWARGTALGEVLPETAAGIVPWDVASSADNALELMRDQRTSAGNVQTVRGAAAALRWDISAERLIEVYNATCNQSSAPAGALERSTGLMRRGLSEDAIRLVGPDGVLPLDVERPLLALAMRKRLRTPVFQLIKAGYRLSARWRHGAPGDNGNR